MSLAQQDLLLTASLPEYASAPKVKDKASACWATKLYKSTLKQMHVGTTWRGQYIHALDRRSGGGLAHQISLRPFPGE